MSPLRSGYAGLHLAHDLDERSAFGARRHRAGGAAGISLAAHALFLLATYVVVTRPDRQVAPSAPDESVPPPELVWLSVAGPGGGGGGGGNRTPAPPARLQTRGLDALSVPVVTPPPLTPPREQPEPRPDPPEIALNVPIKPMDVGQIPVVGAVDGSLAAPPGSQGPGADGGAGTGKNGGSGPGDGPGLGSGSNNGTGGGDVFRPGGDIIPPRVIHVVKPAYTTDAMRVRIQGEVQLLAIVRADGTVTDLKVSRSLDPNFGLDEEAIKAARQWRFKPATRFGQPVAVYVTIGVGFTMH
jgi:periplasmic protein TonB